MTRSRASAMATVLACASVLLLTVACKQKPPTEQSLCDAFGSDLTSYGLSTFSDQVNYEPRSEGTISGFSKDGDRSWVVKEDNSRDRLWPYTRTLSLTVNKLSIVENESDFYPYRGVISWTASDEVRRGDGSRGSGWSGSGKSWQTVYLYGKKTKKWIRSESVTP